MVCWSICSPSVVLFLSVSVSVCRVVQTEGERKGSPGCHLVQVMFGVWRSGRGKALNKKQEEQQLGVPCEVWCGPASNSYIQRDDSGRRVNFGAELLAAGIWHGRSSNR